MTPEQQNIAIAEACGWRHSMARHPQSGRIVKVWTDGKSPWCHMRKPPNYLNDLNKMHEAENGLNNKEHADFRRHLFEDIESDRDELGSADNDERYFVSATAAQRAEAFLRTIKKWEDEQ